MGQSDQSQMLNSKGIRPFSFYTTQSSVIHGILILVAVIVSAYQWNLLENRKKINLKLVQSSVRVDMVAMPKRTFQELKALEKLSTTTAGSKAEPEPQEKKAEPETPDTGKEFIKEKDKVSFSDLMKKYAEQKRPQPTKKTKSKSNSNSEDTLNSAAIAKLDGLIKRGNKVRSGQSLTGGDSNENLTVLESYAERLSNQVRPYWKLPSYLYDKGYKCRIQVFIDKDGRLLRAEIYEKSNEPEYDEKALNAVKIAAPFPVPPQEIVKNTVEGEIALAFPL